MSEGTYPPFHKVAADQISCDVWTLEYGCPWGCPFEEPVRQGGTFGYIVDGSIRQYLCATCGRWWSEFWLRAGPQTDYRKVIWFIRPGRHRAEGMNRYLREFKP